MPDRKSSLTESLGECLKRTQASKRLAEPLLEQIRNGKMAPDYLAKINEFLDSFSGLKDSMEALPVKNGGLTMAMTPAERLAADKLFEQLREEVETLGGYQLEVIDMLKKGMQKTAKDLKLIRNSRGVFQKFVKKPDKGAQFFDVEG